MRPPYPQFCRCLLVAGLSLTLVTGTIGARAKVMTELEDYLEQAVYSLKRGDYESAAARADMLLIPGGIRIRADLSQAGPERQAECRAALAAAIHEWRRALPDLEVTEGAEGPAIVIEFKPEVRYWDQQVAGLTRCRRSKDGITGTIEIRTELGRPLTAPAMARILAHEFGHILGLDDSRDSRDLMGPFRPGAKLRSIGRDEVAAISDMRWRARLVQSQAVVLGSAASSL